MGCANLEIRDKSRDFRQVTTSLPQGVLSRNDYRNGLIQCEGDKEEAYLYISAMDRLKRKQNRKWWQVWVR